MKNYINRKNKILKLGVAFLVLLIASFTIYQSTLVQQEKNLIIGTWINNGDIDWKIKFENNGKCYQYYTGEPTEEFTYSIGSRISDSGLELTNLKLTTVSSNPSQNGKVIEYGINSLGNDKMTLEVFEPKINYFYFTKQ